MKCKTTSDLIQHARKAGADVVRNGGSHVKIKKKGGTVIQDDGNKKSIYKSFHKRAVEDFKAMGIAWEKEEDNEEDETRSSVVVANGLSSRNSSSGGSNSKSPAKDIQSILRQEFHV